MGSDKRIAFRYLYDWDSGEGQGFLLSELFANEGPLLRADILQDAIGELQQLYDATVNELSDAMKQIRLGKDADL